MGETPCCSEPGATQEKSPIVERCTWSVMVWAIADAAQGEKGGEKGSRRRSLPPTREKNHASSI